MRIYLHLNFAVVFCWSVSRYFFMIVALITSKNIAQVVAFSCRLKN